MKKQVIELSNKLRRLSQRGVLRLARYAGKRRFLQIQAEGGLPLDDVEHIEPYGFTSKPLPGAEAITLSLKGNGSHTIAILIDDARYKLQVDDGEVAIFNQFGDKVHVKNDRTIAVEAAVKVEVTTPLVEIKANIVECTGVINAKDFVTHRGVSADNHDHNESIGSTTTRPNA